MQIVQAPKPNAPGDFIPTVSISDLCQILNVSRSTYYRTLRPCLRHIRISDRKIVVVLSDVQKYLTGRLYYPGQVFEECEWDEEEEEEIGGGNHAS